MAVGWLPSLSSGAAFAAERPQTDHVPNIVFILVDDKYE